jgi:hypothetical protein
LLVILLLAQVAALIGPLHAFVCCVCVCVCVYVCMYVNSRQ